mgnify:FL=1
MEIIPVETKRNGKLSASFQKYVTDNQPEHALRFSKRGYCKDGLFINIPLYLVRKVKELL